MPAVPGTLLLLVALVVVAVVVAVVNARAAARADAMERRLEADRAKSLLMARYEAQVAMVESAPPPSPVPLDEGEDLIFTGAAERVVDKRDPGSLTITSRRIVFVAREFMVLIPRDAVRATELSGEQFATGTGRGVRYSGRAIVRFRRDGEPPNERFDVDDDVYLLLALQRSGLPQTGELALPARPA